MDSLPAQVTTQPKPFAFVLMPFDPKFNDVYQLGIKTACEEAGAYCERVDEQMFQGSILARVYNQISKADVLIADMTGRNPNVFYEVGYAHALGKDVILLTQSTDDIPFDLKHHPHIVYGGKIVQLKADLLKRVVWSVANPTKSLKQTGLTLEFFIKGKLVSDKIKLRFERYAAPTVQVSVHNPNSITLVPGSFEIGLVVDPSLHRIGMLRPFNRNIQLPDGKLMALFESMGLLPDGWGNLAFELGTAEYPKPVVTGTWFSEYLQRPGPRRLRL